MQAWEVPPLGRSAARRDPGVPLGGAAAELCRTPGFAEAPREDGGGSSLQSASGGRGLTPCEQCSHLPTFHGSPPPQAVPASDRHGVLRGLPQLGRDAQSPAAMGSPLSVPRPFPCQSPCCALGPASCTNTPSARLSVCWHCFLGAHADAGVADHTAALSTFRVREPHSQRLGGATRRGQREERGQHICPALCGGQQSAVRDTELTAQLHVHLRIYSLTDLADPAAEMLPPRHGAAPAWPQPQRTPPSIPWIFLTPPMPLKTYTLFLSP